MRHQPRRHGTLGADGFNSRTPGGVRLAPLCKVVKSATVSIHAPREGCDRLRQRSLSRSEVSIHAPREGCDILLVFIRVVPKCFNSRTPGGVRLDGYDYINGYVFSFNSRTPGGVRRSPLPLHYAGHRFQFTHPGRGATSLCFKIGSISPLFQFTHPGRGATHHNVISCGLIRFNSRTPGGVRLRLCASSRSGCEFQFTHPGRGATRWLSAIRSSVRSFNSRTPGGVRPVGEDCRERTFFVSIHAPREGCD